MTPELPEPSEVPESEQLYPEERRASALATLLQIMGGEPPAEMLELVDARDQEFAARRAHAA
jgi:hypothetical protein